MGLESVVAIRDGGVRFGGLSVGRITLLGGDAHLGMNVLVIVRTRSPRYDAEAIDRCVRVPLRDRAIQARSPEDL